MRKVSNKLEGLLGKTRLGRIESFNSGLAALLADLKAYYDNFEEKMDIAESLRSVIIAVKSKVFDYESRRRYRAKSEISEKAKIPVWLSMVESSFAELIAELEKVASFVEKEEDLLRGDRRYLFPMSRMIDEEIEKNKDLPGRHVRAYIKDLKEIRKILHEESQGLYGLFEILASQAELLEDLKTKYELILGEIREKSESKREYRQLIRVLKLLEQELARFFGYLMEEQRIVHIGTGLSRKLAVAYGTIRKLGHVFSEPYLNEHNLGLLAYSIGKKEGKKIYGLKGVGIIYPGGKVQVRFFNGKKVRHAELLQVLFDGIPGRKIANDDAVYAYLRALPISRLSRVAGFEFQLQVDDGKLKMINIDYESTILEVQIERGSLEGGEYVPMTKKDFNRLNYAVLYSISPSIINRDEFEQNIKKRGNKIRVIQTRLFPISTLSE